jgi:hypothetical protein
LESPTGEEEEGVYEDIEYETEELFVVDTKKKSPIKGITYEEYLKLAKDFGVSKTSTKQATDRLMKDYIELCKTDNTKYGFSASPIKNNLYHWEIRFFDFEKSVCPDCNFSSLLHFESRQRFEGIWKISQWSRLCQIRNEIQRRLSIQTSIHSCCFP